MYCPHSILINILFNKKATNPHQELHRASNVIQWPTSRVATWPMNPNTGQKIVSALELEDPNLTTKTAIRLNPNTHSKQQLRY